MPVKSCTKEGKSGHKYGNSGKCYTGKSSQAKASQAKAARQGRAIKANQTPKQKDK